jgi:hypothetical protein
VRHRGGGPDLVGWDNTVAFKLFDVLVGAQTVWTGRGVDKDDHTQWPCALRSATPHVLRLDAFKLFDVL